MNNTAKILIGAAFAVAIGFAAVAKNPATFAKHTIPPPVAAQPPVPVQPTEWWVATEEMTSTSLWDVHSRLLDGVERSRECQPAGSLILNNTRHNTSKSPADVYRAYIDGNPQIHSNGDMVWLTIVYDWKTTGYAVFFKNKPSCDAALRKLLDSKEAIRTAAEKAAQAEQRKLDQFLAPYR